MAMPKQFARPPKKQKVKAAAPETAEDFQDAADLEEETGGKWRAGSPEKSGRAFVRALELYDAGLRRHPRNFDLAYNKARLELEVTQQPALIAHIGMPLVDLLKQTLESHRYALRLNEENPDALFNTSQVLTSLAEQLSQVGESISAIPLLQEALELLSGCLSRQEMLLEQQQVDFHVAEDDEGGVSLDSSEKPASTVGSDEEEQTATIENPTTTGDLLDTVHASLSALTTLVSLVGAEAIQALGDMAQSLTEQKAPTYIASLPAEAQKQARFTLALDRANFVAAFADAQYSAYMIETDTYVLRLSAFDIREGQQDVAALSADAEARTELVLSVLARFEGSPETPAETCWTQASLAQKQYTAATKLETSPETYLSRGDVEMLRHRIATRSHAQLSDSIRKSAPTLAQNAQTYYKGAVRLSGQDHRLRQKAQLRLCVAAHVRGLLYGAELTPDVVGFGGSVAAELPLTKAVSDCVEDGLLDPALAHQVVQRMTSRA